MQLVSSVGSLNATSYQYACDLGKDGLRVFETHYHKSFFSFFLKSLFKNTISSQDVVDKGTPNSKMCQVSRKRQWQLFRCLLFFFSYSPIILSFNVFLFFCFFSNRLACLKKMERI